MLRSGINDIRLCYENDVRFLKTDDGRRNLPLTDVRRTGVLRRKTAGVRRRAE